jgi:hypothetical protein
MEKRERFIKISENKIFITPNDSISFHKTNFPENCFGFKSNKEIYWQIELNNYNKVDNSIDIIVLDYHPSNYQSFYNQTQKSPVEYLKFEPLEWRKLEPFLA